MGNRFALLDYEDTGELDTLPEFFKTLKFKWVDFCFRKIKDEMFPLVMDINRETDLLSWKVYFRIFSGVKDIINKDKDEQARLSWHPSTHGYVMPKAMDTVELEEETVKVEVQVDVMESGIDDAFTEDEASDNDDDDEAVDESKDDETDNIDANDNADYASKPDDVSTASSKSMSAAQKSLVKPSKRYRKGWNPHKVSPVFFGYSLKSVQQHQVDVLLQEEDLKMRETRAIETAKKTRISGLDKIEKAATVRENARAAKIKELENVYETSRKKREDELNRCRSELNESAFKLYQVILSPFLALVVL